MAEILGRDIFALHSITLVRGFPTRKKARRSRHRDWKSRNL